MIPKATAEVRPTIDDLLTLGPYHLYLSALRIFLNLGEVANIALIVFAGVEPMAKCANESALFNTKDETFCQRYANGSCERPKFTADFFSIALEWNLFCDRIHIVYLTTSLQMAGILIGALIFGHISDIHGRKKASTISYLILLLAGSLSAISSNWQTFLAFRILVGFSFGGVLSTSYVFIVEFLPKKHRLWFQTLLTPSPIYILFAYVAYLLPDWRQLTITANLMAAPGLLLLSLAKESPRWSIEKGRSVEAKDTLQTIARWRRNGAVDEATLNEVVHHATNIQPANNNRRHNSAVRLFSTRKLAAYSTTLAFLWFTLSVVTYGILFNLGNLTGSRYRNMAYYGAIKYMANLIVILLDRSWRSFGRRVIHTGGITIVGVSFASILYFSTIGEEEAASTWTRAFYLVAAAAASPLWSIAYLLAAELYPTNVRNRVNGFCSIFARLGAVISPQILYMAAYWEPAPHLVMTALAIVDAILFLAVIPETKNRALPENVRTCKNDWPGDEEKK